MGKNEQTLIIEEIYLKANFLVNPLINKTLQSKVILKNEIVKKAINEGIYFVTDEENANRIIEESYISSPEPFISYGLKKPIFYGGRPNLAVACFDLKLPQVITAIKLNISYETLALFQISLNGSAYKLFYPNLLVEQNAIKKVYLGLTVKDYTLCYEEISEDEKENYYTKIPTKEIKNIEKNLAKELKSNLTILKKEKKALSKNLNFEKE